MHLLGESKFIKNKNKNKNNCCCVFILYNFDCNYIKYISSDEIIVNIFSTSYSF
ncbi:hypothetical protein XBKB1_2430003 [Xenorhabdus bovienii str. kraussei Becker Underwood]|uniref:Uncharacterized protein n=1 Tax=Xenorhabdus bovienii str. kraussei Becker Underwood TaxID=1398204 RepID=A0A077PII5_XENBV|nr:hypothetical protein XBKB1_2430003 [Xenorhabdus bovienii str. kraussei Becker Underwood]